MGAGIRFVSENHLLIEIGGSRIRLQLLAKSTQSVPTLCGVHSREIGPSSHRQQYNNDEGDLALFVKGNSHRQVVHSRLCSVVRHGHDSVEM